MWVTLSDVCHTSSFPAAGARALANTQLTIPNQLQSIQVSTRALLAPVGVSNCDYTAYGCHHAARVNQPGAHDIR